MMRFPCGSGQVGSYRKKGICRGIPFQDLYPPGLFKRVTARTLKKATMECINIKDAAIFHPISGEVVVPGSTRLAGRINESASTTRIVSLK
jgi:hypothetical protein